MLKKIKVYGTLRKFLGQAEFEVDLNTPREAISFLVCNFKGIEKHMAEQIYTIQVGTKVITEDLLNLNTKDDIKIIPLVHGNFFQILLGAGALFAKSAIPAKILGSTLLSTVVTTTLATVGTSMVVDGVTSMLTPQQNNQSAASGLILISSFVFKFNKSSVITFAPTCIVYNCSAICSSIPLKLHFKKLIASLGVFRSTLNSD